MKYKIALIGNPNSGKTTLFNHLTGSNQKIGNWPGVTVEKKEGILQNHKEVLVADLPGIYSLSPYSPEEVISRDYLTEEKPHLIVNLVDGSNLERNLYLTTQLAELGTPMIIALNMMDIVHKRGDKIDAKALAEILNVQVIETDASRGKGVPELIQCIADTLEAKQPQRPKPIPFDSEISAVLEKIQEALAGIVPPEFEPYYAVKYFERDEGVLSKIAFNSSIEKEIHNDIEKIEESMEEDAESIIAGARYDFIRQIADRCQVKKHTGMTTSDKIDRIVTHRILGLPIFALIMFAVYFVSIQTVGTMATDYVNEDIFEEAVPTAVSELLENIGASEPVTSLVIDGIIPGVGAVLGFLPQMAVLFLCLAILEDCGYMARVAFVMDRIFRRFGLSGKSFIPLLIGTGCSVPGIQASRTIENESDRKITIITTSFMPCSAKLPAIALISGALFNNSAIVGYSMYALGIAAVMVSGVILKKWNKISADPSPFVMELPLYHAPRPVFVLREVLGKCLAFVKRAGTVIFVSSVAIWFLSNHSWSLEAVGEGDASMLADIGRVFTPLFAPLGFGNWQSAVATIQGFIAKENVLSTMKILLLMPEAGDADPQFYAAFATLLPALNALSFLVFNMLCMPCFAAVGAIRREMGNAKWTMYAVGYQTVFAYAVTFIFYQLSNTFLFGGGFTAVTALALVVLGVLLRLIFRPMKDRSRPAETQPAGVKR